jgi:hypothetical protein
MGQRTKRVLHIGEVFLGASLVWVEETKERLQQVRKSNLVISNIEAISVTSPSQDCILNFQVGFKLKSTAL